MKTDHLEKMATPFGEYWVTNLNFGPPEDLKQIQRMPRSHRILLENLIRHLDTELVTKEDVTSFIRGKDERVLFHPARVLLQDMLGVPVMVDLVAMRDAVAAAGMDPTIVNPRIPVDLVIDHSLMAVSGGSADAQQINEKMEFERNRERFTFLKWCQESFQNLRIIPPDKGILHQLNLEYLAKLVWTERITSGELAYPDTLVGTDSHTPMINSLGILGWGVGGIEAEAAMLGLPISIARPRVVGVNLVGELAKGLTATDLVLNLTHILRAEGVVGAFVEFFGDSLKTLPLATRATIANMAPEYGATCVYFPVDAKTIEYLSLTGRSPEQVALVEAYAKHQGLWGEADAIVPEFERIVEIQLDKIGRSLAGPSRPHDLVPMEDLPLAFQGIVAQSGNNELPSGKTTPIEGLSHELTDGDIVIAAITACTNTSNPQVMIAAGLLAKKATARGLNTKEWIKTTLAPGSTVVSAYLQSAGLQEYLDQLGFNVIGYGCTTCNGMSGPLPSTVSSAIRTGNHLAVSILSGNRNFQARIHPEVNANYLASPPLVVAYALAGNIGHDMQKDPLGYDQKGEPVYLKDIWPSDEEIQAVIKTHLTPNIFKDSYRQLMVGTERWEQLPTSEEKLYPWDPDSTYLKRPPYFEQIEDVLSMPAGLDGLQLLVLLGDTITTDHISPSGAIQTKSPAGRYLAEHGVKRKDFNSYGLRRGNHEVGMRSVFANVQLRNELAGDCVGGYTPLIPDGELMPIFDTAMAYKARNRKLLVIAGNEYGAGSSRDMAAKALRLIGVKAVIAESFERIHRTNLIGMGILPLQFKTQGLRKQLRLDGSEFFDIRLGDGELVPGNKATLTVNRESGDSTSYALILRLDTPDEVTFYRHGGILPYVYRKFIDPKQGR